MTKSLPRRDFIRQLAAGSAVAGLGLWRPGVWAITSPGRPTVLSGTEFDLSIGEIPVNITGAARTALAINGTLPGPLLRWREGDTVTLRVKNQLREPTSIHWHGILLPTDMDGVPGLSFAGIEPGDTYRYHFQVRQHGTYWYHSHSGFQEQQGVYAPLVIDAREPEPFAYERDYVVMLTDWSDVDPMRIMATLKKQSDYYNFHQRTLGDLMRDAGRDGWAATLRERWMWSRMRMSPTDIADVSGHTYTYLLNGLGPSGNWTGIFRPGERIRLRFINGSAMSYFDVRIPGLRMRVVAADGQHVEPIEVDEFRIGVAETYDVIVEPTAAAHTIFAQSMDRSGFARGTLAVRDGMTAPVPPLDARPLLTMSDMGMAHHDMGHADPSHSGNQLPASHDAHASHSSHGGAVAAVQTHPASERHNPLVDMQTTLPTPKLDDPGIGLRDNGRRVLTYADLRSTFADPDGREPSRTIELHLTGHMEKFSWSFDGIRFSDAEPIRLRYGERVRFTLVNDTMMTHPIHLHGLWSDLEDEHGNFLVRKHTIDMPPGSRRSYRVTADALGRWAFHCHLLFHMEMGMFREIRVEA